MSGDADTLLQDTFMDAARKVESGSGGTALVVLEYLGFDMGLFEDGGKG